MECKSICHICLRTDREPRVLDEALGEFLDDITDFAIAISDYQPKYCSECENSLRQFYVFRNKCLEAIKILLQWKKTKPPNKKPINALHMLLSKAVSVCKQEANRVYHVDIIHSKPEGKPNCAFKTETLKTESDPVKNRSHSRQSDKNDGGSETNNKHEKQECGIHSIEQTKIKLETDNENVGKVSETLEYDALNNTTYVYEETTVKIENNDSNEDVNRADYNDSVNDVVIVADNDLTNSSARHLSDTSLNSQDDITDSDIDDVDKQETSQQEYSDTSLNSDVDISDSEVFGAGRPKKKKLKKKTLSELTKIDITSDNDADVGKKVKNKPTRTRRKSFCLESFKRKLSSIFEHCKEVKSTDGTVVKRDAVFNNLVNFSTNTMRQLYNNIRSSEAEFTPKALNLMATIQKRYENKYDAIFDIEYLNTEEQVLEEFAKRRTYECYVTAPFKCELCNRGFQFANMLDYHHKMHHDSSAGEYMCTVCRVRVRTKRLLVSHAQRKHRTVLKCKLCPLVTYDKNAMVKHANHHQGFQYKCSECSAVSKSLSALRSHEMHTHSNEHICRFCARTFTKQHGLDVHRRKKHKDKVLPDGEGVPCDACNITFISSDVYDRHRRITHKERVIGKGRTRRAAATRKRGVRRVSCPACPAVGSCGFWLKQHLRAAHPERPPDTPAHLCDICGKGFASTWILEQHRNVHTGARPFACDQCPATFHTLGSLSAHVPRHGPPRWHCKVCGKQFLSAPNLYNHMRAHIGDRRYKCEMCPAAFLHSGALKEHVRGVHFKQRRVRQRAYRTADSIDNE